SGDVFRDVQPQTIQPRGAETMRRREREDDIGAAPAIVLRHPDEVGAVRSGLGILAEHGEDPPAAAPLQGADDGHGLPTGAAAEGRPGLAEQGIDEAPTRWRPGRKRPTRPARRDLLHLDRHAERLGNTLGYGQMPGAAVEDDPRALAGKRPLALIGG